MNMFDEARAIDGMLRARDITQQTLAKILGVSQPYIANKLRLLKLPKRVQEDIVLKGLSERHARTIMRLCDEDAMLTATERAACGKMNVYQTEIMVDGMLERELCERWQGDTDAERIFHAEEIIEASLSNLRAFGIGARSRKEKHGDKLYISIAIG